MAVKLFGFTIKRDREPDFPSVIPPDSADGAVSVAGPVGGVGAYNVALDLDGVVRSESELVTRYREIALQPEIDSAVDEVVNEIIVDPDDSSNIVDVVVDSDRVPKRVADAVVEEFDNVLELLGFNRNAYQTVRRWYIDGRLYYHAMIDPKEPGAGIRELRYIDPRKIRKVREVKKTRDPETKTTVVQVVDEFYVYNDRGFGRTAQTIYSMEGIEGVKIAKDSIIYVPSGLLNQNGNLVLSYLHKAIKPLNQLRAVEDATVIYRLVRAPERRIFYIDVGNLPKARAEQHLADMMTKHKNRLTYDAATGKIRDDRRIMAMTEDYWLPRRADGKGTEITTLPGGQNLGQIDDVDYFQKRLYRSLNIPIGRIDSESALFNIGRSSEISRDEVKFAKFISRLRIQFSDLFMQVLGLQLILKGTLTADEWDEVSRDVRFKFARDNFFSELKDAEVMQSRFQLAELAAPYVGRYFSHESIRRNVFKQTDEDIARMDREIAAEAGNRQFADPNDMGTPPQDSGD